MSGEKPCSGKRILVVWDSESTELSPLHHALALAERIGGQVTLLRIEPSQERAPFTNYRSEAVLELLNRAREAGIGVSFQTLKSRSEKAVLGFIREQEMDVLVVGEKEAQWGKDLLQMRRGVPSQIIRVTEKNDADFHPRAKRS
ncbi:MAG: universal stress protein [Desulfobacteraceae bacterium]|nr:MAG: universal stress protein [Desulfobacteraceae bacterium]